MKEVVDQTEAECKDWINQVRGLEERIETMEQQNNQLTIQYQEERNRCIGLEQAWLVLGIS